nr:hypothetical protein [uncultured Desulfobacter sp.]
MTISGHKTRAVFERYNIISEGDLMAAARKQEDSLKNQLGTISGTVICISNKKALRRNAESPYFHGTGGET